ncbi:MAG: class II aldolase/adducin family protein, partial [Candidatus Caldarchaeum sp.]
MQSTVEELRIRLKNAADFLFQKSLVRGVEGNISARVPELDAMLIKPTGLPMNKIPPEDYVLIGLDGRVLEGSKPPSKETPMHLEIYRR